MLRLLFAGAVGAATATTAIALVQRQDAASGRLITPLRFMSAVQLEMTRREAAQDPARREAAAVELAFRYATSSRH